MRVVIDEVRAEYSTGIKIQQSVWQNRDLLFYNTPDFAKQVERLSMLEKRAYEIADLLYRAKRPQTSAIVLHVLEGVKHIPFKQDLFIDDINEVFAEKRLDFTLLQAFDFFTKEVTLGDSRANSFRSFRLNTELYLKSIRLADMPAEKFGNEHGRNMFKLLCKTDGGPMLSERYAVNNVYGIRQILEYCVCEGKIENNPLSGFKMKTTVEDTHIHVTRLQLQKMRLMQVGVDLPKELYEFLGISSNFSTWCKRMFEYGFTENQDYTLLSNFGTQNQRGGSNAIDYALTLDTAKEIAMLQRSEKGKQARQYFIECEKQLKAQTQPASIEDVLIQQLQLTKALRLEQEQIKDRLLLVEAKTATRPEYFTIMGFAILKGAKVGLSMAAQLGRKAKDLCHQRGYPVEKIADPRFGQVGCYPKDVLEEVFA